MLRKFFLANANSLGKTSLLILITVALSETSLAAAKQESEQELLDLPLDQLVNVEVVSASRFKQKSSEAPSAVEVVTAEDIRSFGWRTLADALNAMRGLTIRNDRNYTYLNTRGFSRAGDYNSRVLIMINGRRMNEAVFDSAYIAEDFILDMNLIERIEYIPGSGSSVYGANALLGVINVITKQGKAFDGGRISGEIGSLETYRGRLTYGKQWQNGVDVLLNASQFFSHGNEQLFYPEYANVNGGIAQDKDLERSRRVYGQISYRDLTFRGGFVDRYKRVPTAAFEALFNDEFYTVDRQAYVDLEYNHQIDSELAVQLRAFHHWYDYFAVEAYDYNEGVPPQFRVENYDAADSRWWGGEFKFTGTQFAHHKWIAGVELQYDQVQHLTNYDVAPYYLHNDSDRHGWRVGVYAQDEYRLTDSLLLNVGLRLDHHHMIKQLQLHPRIGLVWDVTPTFTTKLLYGSAFRAPNVYERDYVLLGSYASNPNNSEELIKSYEIVGEWYPGDGLKMLGTMFYNDLTQILVQDDTTNQFVNSGAYQTYGFELGSEKHWDNGRLLKLTWTHNYTRDDNFMGGGWAPDSPKNLVKLHYAEPFYNDALRLGFEEIFVDDRRTLANNVATSYHLFNINLALTKPLCGFQASLGVYNVLDHRYAYVGGSEHAQDTLAADGRTARFRLEYGY